MQNNMPEGFQIFKNNKKKEGSNEPDFNVSAKDPVTGKYEPVAACWWKKDAKGNFYQSCTKSKPKPPATEKTPEGDGFPPF